MLAVNDDEKTIYTGRTKDTNMTISNIGYFQYYCPINGCEIESSNIYYKCFNYQFQLKYYNSEDKCISESTSTSAEPGQGIGLLLIAFIIFAIYSY